MLPFGTKLFSTMQLFLSDLASQNIAAQKNIAIELGQVRVIFTPDAL